MDIKYSYYVSSKGFKVVGGTAAQFHKADGSLDNNSYVTTNTPQEVIAQKNFIQSPVIPDGTVGNHAVNLSQLNKYLPTTGGEITGTLTIKPSNSGSVFEQDVITFHDLGTGPSNIIPLAFKYGISTTSTAFIKAVSKGLNGVDGALFQFFDNSTKHTEISSVGVTSNSFVKSGGFSTQFLKANGSVDATVYTPIANVGGAAKSTLTFVSPSYSTTGILRLNLGTNSYAGYLKIKLTGSYASANVNGYIEVTGGLGATSTAIWNNSLKCITSIGVTRSAFYIDPIVKRDAVDGQYYIEIHKKSAANNQIFVEVESRSITTTSPIVLSSTFDASGTVTTLINEVVLEGSITAQAFNKIGGSSSQFLKADGSVDSNSYLTQAILNTQLGNYATLNGVQTFTNTKTFLQSPVVPDATLLPHAVNFGQMSNALEESEGNTVGYVSNNYVNTPDGFAVLLNNGTDLNANLKTGFYRGESLVHAPDNNAGWWFITVENHDNAWVTQKAVSFGAGNIGGLIYQRNLSWDGWSDWEQIWTSKQFSQTNINKWDAAIEKNVVFSTDSTLALMISDGSFNGEAGLVDSDNEVIIAGEENGYWKFATNIGDTGGILVDKNTRRMSYGNVLPSGSYKHNFNGNVNVNDKVTTKGIIHADFNSSDMVLTSDGGVKDITDIGGTLVKYSEVQNGDSFIPPPAEDTHLNLYARGDMQLYLDSNVHKQGKKITVYTNNYLPAQLEVYRDSNLVATIQSGRTTEFILTFTGWIMTDVGTSTFI